MKLLKGYLFSLVLFLGMVTLSLYFYPHLPENIPTKFDFSGNPTQYSSREFVTVFLPAVYLALILFIGFMVKASPHRFSMPNSRKTVDVIVAGCGLLFSGIHLGMLLDPGGKEIFNQFFSFGIALFLIVVGNVLGKTERNFMMGVRVPWTLASEANWRATHRFSGRMMVLTGLALLVLSFFHTSFWISIAAILVPTMSPIVYSYLYFLKHEARAGLWRGGGSPPQSF